MVERTDTRQYPKGAAEGQRVMLEPISAYYWTGTRREHLTELDTAAAREDLAKAHEAGSPIWLKLGLPELDSQTRKSLEGSQPVWSDEEERVVSWSGLVPLLKSVGLKDPEEKAIPGDPRATALQVLSRVYSRGVYRSAREVWPELSPAETGPPEPSEGGAPDPDRKALKADPPPPIRLFPSIGFRRSDIATVEKLRGNPDTQQSSGISPEDVIGADQADDDPNERRFEDLTKEELEELAPEFWVYRANIGVIGNVTITIQLPDLRFGGRLIEEPAYEIDVDERVDLPDRFLPFRQPTAIEVAEGIALHQAASARDAAEKLRDELGVIEKVAAGAYNTDTGARRSRHQRRERAQALHTALLDMQKTIDQLDRQISRLLRRFGSFGDDANLEAVSDETEPAARIAPAEVKLRYRYGLDEVRSLRDDTRLAESALEAEMHARDARDRERFEIAAALLGALVLIPTLIAGLYGANVRFPGEGDTLGLWILIATLGFASAAVALAMAVAWTKNWDPLSTIANEKSLTKLLGVVGATSFVAWITLLTIGLGLEFLIVFLALTWTVLLHGRRRVLGNRWKLIPELVTHPGAPRLVNAILFSFPLITAALLAVELL